MILTAVAAGPVVPGAARTVTGDRVTILLGGALTALVTVLAIRAWWTGLGKRKCKPIN